MRIRTFLKLTTMLLLSGAMTSSASAQTPLLQRSRRQLPVNGG